LRDSRSNKAVLVAHCLLNQNSVVLGRARRSGMVSELVEELVKEGVGVVQLPCPELIHFGIKRFWQVREQMDSVGFRETCKKLANEVVKLVRELEKGGVEILGVIGVKGSPSCGVTEVNSGDWAGPPQEAKEKRRVPGMGIFMEELSWLLEEVPFIDWDWDDLDGSLKEVRSLLRGQLGG